MDHDRPIEPLAIPSFVKALDADHHGSVVQLLLGQLARPEAAHELLDHRRAPLMPQKHEELHRLLAFEMGRQSDGHEVLGPLPSDGCEVFFLALGQDPAHLALNRQRRLVQFEEPQLCLGLLHAHECLDADRHLDFEFLPGDFAAPVSSPDPLDHLSALLPVIRLIQFTLVFQTGFLAHRFELQVLILDLRLQLVGLMLLKLKELLATPLDSLPFVGHLILFVEIRMIQSLQFIELLLIFDVVVPLLYQLDRKSVV